MREASAQPRIAVIGGGIGGLAAAGFLRRAGLTATVYEQAAALTEVGAGIVVTPNAARMLRRLDVMADFLRGAVPLDLAWEFRRWVDGTVLSVAQSREACEQRFGESLYTMHRADLLDTVKSAVPADWVRLNARCTSIDERADEVRLEFADGSRVTADVVIGADGLHSMLRGVVTEPSPPKDSGMCAFRATVPIERAPEFARRPAQTLWLGPGHHLVHYPISGGRQINVVAIAPTSPEVEESWSATATVEEFLAEFAGWDPRVTALITAGGDPGRWALLDREPLTTWSTARVTLLGDAAHPMFPFYAQGAAQAIEDAAVLAARLADHPDDPASALRAYESTRIPRTTRIQEVSHARRHHNHLPDGPEQQARDQSLATADPLTANEWIYDHNPLA